MATLAVTNSFSAGTTIVAADMNTNFDDVEAFVNTTPGVVQNDIVDVLGDLIVASGADAVSRLAAGTNNHVLTADSTVSAHGLKWAAAPTPTDITVADTTDTTCSVALFESATGDLAPKTDAGATYNAGTGTLTATAFAGPLTGNVTGNASGSALTVTQAAQSAITSVGTLTALTVSGTTTTYLNVITDSTTTRTPALADASAYILTTHGTGITITLPQDSAVAFPTGSQIVFERNGAGTMTFAAGTGATVNSKGATLTCADRYTTVAAVKIAANTWTIFGNIG